MPSGEGEDDFAVPKSGVEGSKRARMFTSSETGEVARPVRVWTLSESSDRQMLSCVAVSSSFDMAIESRGSQKRRDELYEFSASIPGDGSRVVLTIEAFQR